MADSDPYAILGVPRTATREEIARAYRRLAKRHHPDAGAPPSPTMARINEAWYVLGSTTRRARWDAEHRVVHAPTWSVEADQRRVARRPSPPPRPDGPRSIRDSGWLAVVVLIVGSVLVGGTMLGLASLAENLPQDDGLATFTEPGLFNVSYPEEWNVAPGDGSDPDAHRVLAHVLTFDGDPARGCTAFGDRCGYTGDDIPPRNASIIFTAHAAGAPPVPDPIVSRPFGLDADRIIGGEPAVFETHAFDGGRIAWWQLSPPGFPDRWIEVYAEVSGRDLDTIAVLEEIDAMLSTLEWVEDGADTAGHPGG